MKFKKISALVTSFLLVGMTAGVAAAANFPQPFSQHGTTGYAVVYGSNAPGEYDQGQATIISNHLIDIVGSPSTSGSVGLGSETVQIRGPIQQFNLGRNASAVFTTGDVRKNNMENLLADGSYFDNDNEEFKFTQKITLSENLVLNHFKDSDYSDVPEIGINLNSGVEVLKYTLDFNTRPTYNNAQMKGSDLFLFGKDYFVLSADNTTSSIELLDSADTTVLNQGESTTLTVGGKPYNINIQAISGTAGTDGGVIFVVDGTPTRRLNTGQTYKLPDGSHLGVKDFQTAQFAGDTAFAEFSIGSGKLVLTNDQEVQLNEKVVNGLVSGIGQSAGKLWNLTLTWNTDDREFITPTNEILMPGFETLKLAMTEFSSPEQESFTVERDGDSVRISEFAFADGSGSLNLIYGDSSGIIQGLGKDSNNRLVTSSTANLLYQRGLNHKMFVASYDETAWAESYLLSISSVVFKDGTNKTTIRNEITRQNICEEISPGQTCTIGPITLTVNQANRSSGSDWNVSLTTSAGAGGFNELYSENGLKVYLPYLSGRNGNETTKLNGELWLPGTTNSTEAGDGHNNASWHLYFHGQDKDGNIANAAGSQFKLNLTKSGGSTVRLHVGGITNTSAPSQLVAGALRIGDSGDKYEYYTYTDVPTQVVYDQAGDHHKAEITYFGGESYGKIYLSSTDVTETPGQTGTVLVTDSQVSTVQGRNLIVVGGSCINTVAANLVGGAHCGDAWTTATGVGSGQYLIQSYANPYTSGKIALLVAGYEQGDTVNAATYLRTQTVDTTVGKKYIGTTGTSAQSMTAEA